MQFTTIERINMRMKYKLVAGDITHTVFQLGRAVCDYFQERILKLIRDQIHHSYNMDLYKYAHHIIV